MYILCSTYTHSLYKPLTPPQQCPHASSRCHLPNDGSSSRPVRHTLPSRARALHYSLATASSLASPHRIVPNTTPTLGPTSLHPSLQPSLSLSPPASIFVPRIPTPPVPLVAKTFQPTSSLPSSSRPSASPSPCAPHAPAHLPKHHLIQPTSLLLLYLLRGEPQVPRSKRRTNLTLTRDHEATRE